MTKRTHDQIRNICLAYNERKREIAIGDKGRPRRAAMIAEYMRLNSAIDTALLLIEAEPLRTQLRKAIVEGVGFESFYIPYCGRNLFYAHKRRVMQEIARLLHLSE